MLGVRGVGDGVGEGLPSLSHHAAIRISDLDAVVGDGVMGGGDHQADGGSGLERPQHRQYRRPEHRRCQDRALRPKPGGPVRKLRPCKRKVGSF